MDLGFSPTVSNTFLGYSHVTNFASLPVATSHAYEYWIVDTTTGVFLINQKKAGFYKSDGANWNYIGTSVDMTSLSDGSITISASPIIISGGNGITTSANATTNTITITASASAQVQSDWNEATTSAVDYIKNKPTIPTNTNQLTNGSGYKSIRTTTGVIAFGNEGNYIESLISDSSALSTDTVILTMTDEDAIIQQVKCTLSSISAGVGYYVRTFAPDNASGNLNITVQILY